MYELFIRILLNSALFNISCFEISKSSFSPAFSKTTVRVPITPIAANAPSSAASDDADADAFSCSNWLFCAKFVGCMENWCGAVSTRSSVKRSAVRKVQGWWLVGLRVAIITVTDSTRIEALTADLTAFKHSSELDFHISVWKVCQHQMIQL